LLKIRQSKAWHRYYQQKLVDKNRSQNYFNEFKNEYFNKKILQNSPNKLSNKLLNKSPNILPEFLPKFLIFHTKNFNISSTKLRRDLTSQSL
jgi:hypothetical protein